MELPQYDIILSFHDTIGSMEEDKDPKNSRILHAGIIFFSLCEDYNFLFPLLWNGCSLIDPFVFWRFYKVLFESVAFK